MDIYAAIERAFQSEFKEYNKANNKVNPHTKQIEISAPSSSEQALLQSTRVFVETAKAIDNRVDSVQIFEWAEGMGVKCRRFSKTQAFLDLEELVAAAQSALAVISQQQVAPAFSEAIMQIADKVEAIGYSLQKPGARVLWAHYEAALEAKMNYGGPKLKVEFEKLSAIIENYWINHLPVRKDAGSTPPSKITRPNYVAD